MFLAAGEVEHRPGHVDVVAERARLVAVGGDQLFVLGCGPGVVLSHHQGGAARPDCCVGFSGWRRKVQSWLTRTLAAVFRWPQPSVVPPMAKVPAPLRLSARSPLSRASAAAARMPAEKNGASFCAEPVPTLALRNSPLAPRLSELSFAEAVIGMLTTSAVTTPNSAMQARMRLPIDTLPVNKRPTRTSLMNH